MDLICLGYGLRLGLRVGLRLRLLLYLFISYRLSFVLGFSVYVSVCLYLVSVSISHFTVEWTASESRLCIPSTSCLLNKRFTSFECVCKWLHCNCFDFRMPWLSPNYLPSYKLLSLRKLYQIQTQSEQRLVACLLGSLVCWFVGSLPIGLRC